MLGIDKEQKKKVEFTLKNITVHQILEQFDQHSALEELVCDAELELHILAQHAQNNILCPTLKIVNGVSLDVANPTDRGSQKTLT